MIAMKMKVTIQPTTLQDKRKVFDWLAHSNLTSEMLGPPKFPDNPAPSWEEFQKDYVDHYFDGSNPEAGRCFLILCDDTEVGQINYNPIDKQTHTTELDIWLAERKYAGRGIGTTAIKLLCKHLFEELDCREIVIQPSARNAHAIRAYLKAGFVIQSEVPPGFVLDYHDSTVMTLSKAAHMP